MGFSVYSFTVAQVCEIYFRILLESPDVIERNLAGVLRDSATLAWILIDIDVDPEKLNQDVRDMINAEWGVETVYAWLKENSVKIVD